jgi:cobalamin synthase
LLIEWSGYRSSVGYTGIATAVVSIAASGLLFYGTFKDRPKFLIPWMVVEFFSTILSLILAALVTFVASSYADVLEEHFDSIDSDITADTVAIASYIFFALCCIIAAINFYFIWVVGAFYKELKDEGAGQMNGKV